MATLVGGYVPSFSHVVFWVFVSGSAHLIQGHNEPHRLSNQKHLVNQAEIGD